MPFPHRSAPKEPNIKRNAPFEATTSTAKGSGDGQSPLPPARWVRIAAHVAALTPLPSALWRISLVFGFSGGFTEQGLIDLNIAGWGWIYLVTLSVLTELAALLTLGLVQPWGEVAPRWVPLLGGRSIPKTPVIFAASMGAILLMVLWTPLLFWWNTAHPEMTTTGNNVVGILYLPLVIWGPLLAVVTVSYSLRRRAAAPQSRPSWPDGASRY